MSGTVDSEAPRPRPLSGGLWTLFSWLRRDDHTSSSESLSSAGSDRTVASFAFLTPAHYRITTAPIVLPPPGPPTDSYKKRVRERNLRRQHDRDLTLHRKYGLYRGDIAGGYDAFSLPSAHRSAHCNDDRQDRERRAVSESLQRRAAYVPGKRRAPSPPVRVSSLPHRHSRKRRAPQPPGIIIERTKENLGIVETQNKQMNRSIRSKNTVASDVSMGCKSEKYVKKEKGEFEVKGKQEKSFLKQIFENKKRHSAIETSSVKILPSISELDKQAAEIIETCKSKARESNNFSSIELKKKYLSSDTSKEERWLCITCSRFYDTSLTACPNCMAVQKPSCSKSIGNNENQTMYTQTENTSVNVTSPKKKLEVDEKQQLKEMLKEMKYSLPTKSKLNSTNDHTKVSGKKISPAKHTTEKNMMTETPTLRIGSLKQHENKNVDHSPNKITEISTVTSNTESDNKGVKKASIGINTKSELLVNKKTVECGTKSSNMPSSSSKFCGNSNNIGQLTELLKKGDSKDNAEKFIDSIKTKDLHVPLKISSLLNPIYIPKENTTSALSPRISLHLPTVSGVSHLPSQNREKHDNVPKKIKIELQKQPSASQVTNVTTSASFDSPCISSSSQNSMIQKLQAPKVLPLKVEAVLNTSTNSSEPQPSSSSSQKPTTNIEKINQHTRRRDLINQLEQSIAKGDERAAAEAASKLAQLRLSCSVLSFSSQILGGPSKSSGDECINKETKVENNNGSNDKQAISRPASTAVNNTVVPPLHLATNALSKIVSEQMKLENGEPKINHELPNNEPVPANTKNIKKSLQGNTGPVPIQAHTEAPGSRKNTDERENVVLISVWIEDKEAARGPVKLRIQRNARLGDLRQEAEVTLGLERRLQRWIIGRTLCSDDNTALVSLAGPDLNAPFYLCLVEYDAKAKSISPAKDQTGKRNDKVGDVYTELMQLESQALVANADLFECGVCMENCTAGQGVVLRECVHSFCKDCLADMIRHCEEPAISCPAVDCPGVLHEREIRALVSPEDYERWLARGLAAAESANRNAFHCRTRDCTGWAFCEPGVRKFPCPVCKCTNCVPCQAIHEGETCEAYRSKVQQAASSEPNTDEGTRALLDSLISRGEAVECPECNAIITKKWGCDWVKCSACKTEICWVTRGRRWGPGGRGDTSGGCRCGIDGKRCHPSCGYCH